MAIKTAEDLFIHELSDIYSAEKQMAKALPRLARAATDPDLAAALQACGKTDLSLDPVQLKQAFDTESQLELIVITRQRQHVYVGQARLIGLDELLDGLTRLAQRLRQGLIERHVEPAAVHHQGIGPFVEEDRHAEMVRKALLMGRCWHGHRLFGTRPGRHPAGAATAAPSFIAPATAGRLSQPRVHSAQPPAPARGQVAPQHIKRCSGDDQTNDELLGHKHLSPQPPPSASATR